MPMCFTKNMVKTRCINRVPFAQLSRDCAQHIHTACQLNEKLSTIANMCQQFNYRAPTRAASALLLLAIPFVMATTWHIFCPELHSSKVLSAKHNYVKHVGTCSTACLSTQNNRISLLTLTYQIASETSVTCRTFQCDIPCRQMHSVLADVKLPISA